MNKPRNILSLDVGEKRIGLASADTSIRIPVTRGVVVGGEGEIERILAVYSELECNQVVIGLPRNSKGEETAQSVYVRSFAQRLSERGLEVFFQDESLTSVKAEEYLLQSRKPYTKGDIDTRAAAIILEDYLQSHYDW